MRSAAATTGKKNIALNALFNALGFLTAVAIAFVMSPILVHRLGDRQYGTWALVDSVLAYLSLFDLGIGAAVVRYVAKFEETRDRAKLPFCPPTRNNSASQ